jgi:hypothetical protein
VVSDWNWVRLGKVRLRAGIMDGNQVCKIYLFGIYWNFIGNFQNFWDLFGFSGAYLIYLGFLNNF